MRIAPLFALLFLGCGSSESSTAPPADTGPQDTGEKKAPPQSCVQPGDKGNDKGVGTPCTPLGKECQDFPGAPVCLADVGQDQWMCTRIGCTSNEQCGADATCYKDPKGSGCVPNRCLKSDDAGTDAPADAPVAPTDASDAADASSD